MTLFILTILKIQKAIKRKYNIIQLAFLTQPAESPSTFLFNLSLFSMHILHANNWTFY